MPYLLCLIFLFAAAATAAPPLRVATTTSTQDSGLLDVLNPAFTAATSIAVNVIAVGSGKALALGRNGDVDMVLAHDPDAEARFIADGAGIDRREIMVNEFLVVGPAHDPAQARGADSASAALARIARRGAPFVSRGDQSGTHVRELALFRAAGIDPAGPWYFSAGQGMNPVLQIADEKLAYTLVDRGTWLARRRRLSLVVVYAGDPALANVYHVMTVNPAAHPHVQVDAARAYADFLTGPEGQALIGAFTVDGEQLFTPSARR